MDTDFTNSHECFSLEPKTYNCKGDSPGALRFMFRFLILMLYISFRND